MLGCWIHMYVCLSDLGTGKMGLYAFCKLLIKMNNILDSYQYINSENTLTL